MDIYPESYDASEKFCFAYDDHVDKLVKGTVQ